MIPIYAKSSAVEARTGESKDSVNRMATPYRVRLRAR